VEGETSVARKRVQDAAIAIMQDKTPAENGGATTRQHEPRFEEIMNTIRDSLSDLACSDHEQDEEHEEDDEDVSELNKLSDDDEPGWVMDTISKTIQHRMESFRPKQLRIDELTNRDGGKQPTTFMRDV
jgi:hypothetical protein